MQYPLRSAVLSFCSEGYMRHSTSQILRMLPDLPMKVMGVGEWKERETSGYLFSVLPPGLIKMLAVTHSCRHGFPFHGSSLLSTRATSSSSFCPDTPCPTNILILAIGQFPGKWTQRDFSEDIYWDVHSGWTPAEMEGSRSGQRENLVFDAGTAVASALQPGKSLREAWL